VFEIWELSDPPHGRERNRQVLDREPGRIERRDLALASAAPARTAPRSPTSCSETRRASTAWASSPSWLACSFAERFEWVPEPGSKASVDLAEKLFDERYNDSLVSRPRENASMYLTGGANHLAGLATMFRQRELWFAPGLLARAAVEHGARAVLALDPRLKLRTQVARAMIDDALSVHFSKLAVCGLVGKQTAAYQATEERWDTIRRVAAECFNPVSFEGRPHQWNVEGHAQLGFHRSRRVVVRLARR